MRSTVHLTDGTCVEVLDDAEDIRKKLYMTSDFLQLRGWSLMHGEYAVFFNRRAIVRIVAKEPL